MFTETGIKILAQHKNGVVNIYWVHEYLSIKR